MQFGDRADCKSALQGAAIAGVKQARLVGRGRKSSQPASKLKDSSAENPARLAPQPIEQGTGGTEKTELFNSIVTALASAAYAEICVYLRSSAVKLLENVRGLQRFS